MLPDYSCYKKDLEMNLEWQLAQNHLETKLAHFSITIGARLNSLLVKYPKPKLKIAINKTKKPIFTSRSR